MPYETLEHIYYKNPEQWQSEYKKRFNSDIAIKLNFQINENQAFYLETPELLKRVIQMQKLDKEILLLINKLPTEAINQFKRSCLIDEIVLTNSIEGVHSTRRDVEDILSELETKNRHKRFYGLISKYYMLLKNSKLNIEKSEDIREIYNDLVLSEIASDNPENIPDGKIFRKESISVYSPSGKELHRGVYPESKIIDNMNSALQYINNSNDELPFSIATFHYLFGYIHPFYDGNGRTSRFISSYLLSKYFEPTVAYRLSYTIKENIKQYYDAFKTCNSRHNLGDITPFIYTFFEIIEKSLYQLKTSLEEKYNRLKYYEKHMKLLNKYEAYESIYFVLVQATLFAENGISTKELIEYLNCSRTTLNNKLKTISNLEKTIISKYRSGKENYYSLNLHEFDNIILSKAKHTKTD